MIGSSAGIIASVSVYSLGLSVGSISSLDVIRTAVACSCTFFRQDLPLLGQGPVSVTPGDCEQGAKSNFRGAVRKPSTARTVGILALHGSHPLNNFTVHESRLHC